MLLSSRSKRIIVFLAQQDEYVTYDEIGKHIGISGRTAAREMPTCEDWLDAKGIALTKKSRYGIIMDADEKQKSALIEELSEEKVYKVFTSKDRQDIMLLDLMKSNEELKQYYFSKLLGVSKATISQDLNKLNDRLKKHSLSIERKAGLGFKLVGTEEKKREFMLNVFYSHLNTTQVLKIIRKELAGENQNLDVKSQAIQRLLHLVSPEKLFNLETIVKQVISKNNYPLADSSEVGLIVHLVLAVERIKNNEYIMMQDDMFDELKSSEEFVVASEILKVIANEYDLDIPKHEAGYITMHIKGSRLKEFAKGKFEKEMPNFDIAMLVNRVVDIAEQITGHKLNSDKQLYNGLIVHLKPMMIRLKMGLRIRNPLLEEIKSRYPAYFKIAMDCKKPLDDYLGMSVPDEEVGYLGMHIGAAIERMIGAPKRKARAIVTCTTGIGSSKMLAVRLNKELPEIEVADVLSVIEFSKQRSNTKGADLIISTVEIENVDLPVVVVTPMLNEKDIIRLRNALITLPLEKIKEKKKKIVKDKAIKLSQHELFEQLDAQANYGFAIKSFLNHNVCYKSEKQTINDILLEYLENNIDENLRESAFKGLLNREELGSTILAKHQLVLFHSKAKGISGLNNAIINLDDVIEYKDNSIKTLVVLLVPENISKIEIDVVSEISRQLVISDELIISVKKGDSDDVKNTMAGLFKQLMVKKFM